MYSKRQMACLSSLHYNTKARLFKDTVGDIISSENQGWVGIFILVAALKRLTN